MFSMLRLLVIMSMLGMAVSSPRERVMVKYKVKDGVKGERMKVIDINDKDEALSKNIVDTEALTVKGTKSQTPSGNEYKEKAKVLVEQLQRAARSGDL